MIIAHGADFDTTHDIGALLDTARAAGESIPHDVEASAALSTFAGSGRYDFDTDPEHADVSEEELQEALEQSRRVVEWADGRITTTLQGLPPP